MNLNKEKLYEALTLLDSQIGTHSLQHYELVICGGSALIATDLVERTTKDVDVLAVKDDASNLMDPNPLSKDIESAALAVSQILGLSGNWLNTGPADLFRMGLPENFEERLIT